MRGKERRIFIFHKLIDIFLGFLTPEQKTAKAILKKIEEKVHGLTAPTMVGCDDSESEEDDIEEIESDSSQNIIPDPLPPSLYFWNLFYLFIS